MAPKTSRRTVKAKDYGGMDPALIEGIVGNITPNPVTGKVEMSDIMSYMSRNPEQMDAMIGQMDALSVGKASAADLDSFDWASLKKTIKKDSFWVVQLEHWGMADASGAMIEPEKAHSTKGVQQVFMIYCYDDKGGYRVTQQCTGLPTSDNLLRALRMAIAKPVPPLKPALPNMLLVSHKFSQHITYVKTFLDSLPTPFHWRMETPEEAETVASGVHGLNEKSVSIYTERAAAAKAKGNAAFLKKDRKSALKAYETAIDALLNVLSSKPDTGEEKEAQKQIAMCYANRAATHLLPGSGLDPHAALKDGEMAEKCDPDYGKGYYRQSAAHKALSDANKAQHALARALRRPALQNDTDLTDKFVDLLTDGKGLSDDEAVFKDWWLDIHINDPPRAEVVKGVEGEWRRRLDKKFKEFADARGNTQVAMPQDINALR